MLKKLIIIILQLLVFLGISFAQNDAMKFNESSYKIAIVGNCMEMYITDSVFYQNLDEVTKNYLIESNARKYGKIQRAVVRCGYEREIWVKGSDSSFNFSFEKDVNDFRPADFQRKTNAVYSKADFFSYAGMAMDFSSSHFTFNVSTRFGCYFFKRFIDASVIYSYSVTSSNGSTFSAMTLGLMARQYPFYKKKSMQRLGLSPYTGGEIAWRPTFVEGNRSDSFTINILIGISWLIGPGSLDIGVQGGLILDESFDSNATFAATIGYSFCPFLLFNVKKNKQ